MIAQTPARGILQHKSYGDVMTYRIDCECEDPDCSHYIWVEADEHDVTCILYTTQKTDWWSNTVEPRYDIENDLLQWYNWAWTGFWNGLMTRLRLTKNIWFDGYVKYERSITLSEQTTLNYSATLKNAMQSVKDFRNKRKV
jgi:hypothetical protein